MIANSNTSSTDISPSFEQHGTRTALGSQSAVTIALDQDRPKASSPHLPSSSTIAVDRVPSRVIIHPEKAGANPDRVPAARTETDISLVPYSAFSKHSKWLIVLIGGMAAVFSPISSNIFVPAIPTLSTAFHKSEEDITLAVTIYLVFQATTPSIFGAMSDSLGRRPIYIGTLVVYMGANVGLALLPTSAYWALLVLRALQATGGSAVIAVGAGCIADIAEPRERGKFMSVFQLGVLIGPCFGPLLGGILADTLGWRSIFWFLTIATGVVLVPLILFMPETLRSLVGNGSIPPPAICSSPMMLVKRKRMERELKAKGEAGVHIDRPLRPKYRPLSAFLVLFTPEIFLIFVFASLLYLEFYCVITLLSTTLQDTYHLDDLKIGLCYLPSGIGAIFASLINGRQIDFFYRREEKRVGGDYRSKPRDFRIEYTRIRCLYPFMFLYIVASTALGWCLQVKAPLAATLVVNFFVGLGTGTINTATVYGFDIKPGQGGAVSASLNLVRCLFGAIGTSVIQVMYKHLGAGWSITILSGLCVVGLPLPFLVIARGQKWREAREDRKDRKQAEREERTRVEEAGERGLG